MEKLSHVYGEWTVTQRPTLTETGLKERVCAACGSKETQEIPVLSPAAYSIISGANGEWTKGSAEGLSITSDAPFDKFEGVKVDGTVIAEENYTAVSGSTKVTLTPAYLETLDTAAHFFEIVSVDGSASTRFTVKEADPTDPTDPANPQTGNNSDWYLWAVLLFVSDGVFGGTAAYGKRRKNRAE